MIRHDTALYISRLRNKGLKVVTSRALKITTMFGYFLLAGFVCIVQGNQPCGHGHTVCTTVSQAEVNHAIVDLNLHYNNDMCLELLLIDCAKHVTQGDEVVCASNGKTYDNHCRFIHARCEYYLIGHATELTKVHSGPCQTTTAAAIVSTTMAAVTGSTAVTSGTMASGNTTGNGTTMPPAGSASTTMAAITGSMAATASTMGAVSGMTADTTTTMAASASTGTTTVQVTSVLPTGSTTPSVNNMIQQLFCKNVDSVQCGQDFSIVCGTDGQFYPNSCELSKAKCKDVTLTVEPDSSRCITP